MLQKSNAPGASESAGLSSKAENLLVILSSSRRMAFSRPTGALLMISRTQANADAGSVNDSQSIDWSRVYLRQP
jgi:hypothetical protein